MLDQPVKPGLPTGTVTLLFTDIVGSSRLWDKHGDRFIPVWQAHDAVLRDAFARFNGFEVKTEGDAFMVAFSDPTEALHCALFAQAALRRYPWPEDIGPLKVRMGLHIGEPFVFHNDYFGPVVNRAACICKAGHGGQVLLSEETLRAVKERIDPKIEFLDLGEQRLKDMGEPQRLYEASHPSCANAVVFPPPRTLESQPNNLPVQRTSFVGRAAEIEAIASFLAQGQKPLLTITGPGGIGKTRLSLQAAAAKAEWFPDGVWYVKLVEARDVVGAAIEIASCMCIPLHRNRPPLDQVRDWLADRRCLLILDDANTLPHADRLIRELLSGSTGLRCLATSRESLQISESDELAIGTLPVSVATTHAVVQTDAAQDQIQPPVRSVDIKREIEQDKNLNEKLDEKRTDASRTLTETDAGRMFLEVLAVVNPGIKLPPAEVDAAAQLLEKLDGAPVSIERAAQMMDRVPPSVVLEWLDQRLSPDRVPAKSVGVQKFKGILRGAAQKVSDRVEGIPRALEANLGRLLQGVANMATERQDDQQATQLGRESLRISQQAGDTLGTAAALRQLGRVKWQQGDRQSAVALLTASAQLYRECQSDQYLEVQHEVERARELLEQTEGAVPIIPTLDGAVAMALEEKSVV